MKFWNEPIFPLSKEICRPLCKQLRREVRGLQREPAPQFEDPSPTNSKTTASSVLSHWVLSNRGCSFRQAKTRLCRCSSIGCPPPRVAGPESRAVSSYLEARRQDAPPRPPNAASLCWRTIKVTQTCARLPWTEQPKTNLLRISMNWQIVDSSSISSKQQAANRALRTNYPQINSPWGTRKNQPTRCLPPKDRHLNTQKMLSNKKLARNRDYSPTQAVP